MRLGKTLKCMFEHLIQHLLIKNMSITSCKDTNNQFLFVSSSLHPKYGEIRLITRTTVCMWTHSDVKNRRKKEIMFVEYEKHKLKIFYNSLAAQGESNPQPTLCQCHWATQKLKENLHINHNNPHYYIQTVISFTFTC